MTSPDLPATQVTADDRAPLPTRPPAARPNRRVRPVKEKVRFTLDLPNQQHMFLRMFSLTSGYDASKICRALLLRMEHDPVLAEQVLDDLYDSLDDDAGPGES